MELKKYQVRVCDEARAWLAELAKQQAADAVDAVGKHDRIDEEVSRREGPVDGLDELQVGGGIDHEVLEVLPVEVLDMRLLGKEEVFGGQSNDSPRTDDPRQFADGICRSFVRTEVFDRRKRPAEVEGVCRIDTEVGPIERLELNNVASDGPRAKPLRILEHRLVGFPATGIGPTSSAVQIGGDHGTQTVTEPKDDAFATRTDPNGLVVRLNHVELLEAPDGLGPLPSLPIDVRRTVGTEDVRVV